MTRRSVAAWLTLTMMMVLSGCGDSAPRDDGPPPEISYTVVNHSGGMVVDLMMVGTVRPMGMNPLGPGESRTLRDPVLDIPAELRVGWTSPAGDRIIRNVELHDELGDDYVGPVQLEITFRQEVEASVPDP